MGMPAMKAHPFARGFREHEPTSLTLGCKRLRPLAPKLTSTTTIVTTAATPTFDLKSFIRPDSGPRKAGPSDHRRQECSQVENQGGGTRWNPTQEQIGILETLYRGGMRTPNAQQIEQITAELAKYGKIEGKNVFYWFQNHKARERQKQKRNTPRTPLSPFSSTSSSLLYSPGEGVEEEFCCISQKRKCCLPEEEEEDRTLELFPLHPDGIRDGI
ncbi:hypothetical protein ACS0TY_023566 [Phlomoides rotata]